MTKQPAPVGMSSMEVVPGVKRVLLAGATGTLGTKLIPALTDLYEVAALARPGSETKLESAGPALSSIRVGQVTDPLSLKGVCDGIDTVVTTVGITRQKDGLTYDQVDYEANLNLLREAERARVRRFLFVSVVGADQTTAREHEKIFTDVMQCLLGQHRNRILHGGGVR